MRSTFKSLFSHALIGVLTFVFAQSTAMAQEKSAAEQEIDPSRLDLTFVDSIVRLPQPSTALTEIRFQEADAKGRYTWVAGAQPPKQLVMLGLSLRQLEDRVLVEHLPIDDDTGLVVARILAQMPSQKAGLNINDIICKVDNKSVLTVEDFIKAYEDTANEEVVIEYIHKGNVRRTSINKTEAAESSKRFRIGVYTDQIPEALAIHLGREVDSGLYVTKVVEDSPAKKAGIKAGDILVVADDKQLGTSTVLYDAVQATRGKEPLKLELVRKGQTVFMQVLAGEDGTALDSIANNLAAVDLVQLAWVTDAPTVANQSVGSWVESTLPQSELQRLAQEVKELRAEISRLSEKLEK